MMWTSSAWVGELSEIALRRLDICRVGSGLGEEVADVDYLPADRDSSRPSFFVSVGPLQCAAPTDSPCNKTIGPVLLDGCFSEVFYPIVGYDAVDVVQFSDRPNIVDPKPRQPVKVNPFPVDLRTEVSVARWPAKSSSASPRARWRELPSQRVVGDNSPHALRGEQTLVVRFRHHAPDLTRHSHYSEGQL